MKPKAGQVKIDDNGAPRTSTHGRAQFRNGQGKALQGTLPVIAQSYKRELLYRKARGKIVSHLYKEKILFLLDKEVDDSLFLDLIETDSLITRLTEGIKISAEDVEFATTRKCFEFVSSKIIAGNYFLLLDADWKYCGAYKHEGPPILNPTFDFNKFHSDEIRLISADFSTEITIDYSDAHNTKLFELRTCKYHPS